MLYAISNCYYIPAYACVLQIDCSVIACMDMKELENYFKHYGDCLAVKAFCEMEMLKVESDDTTGNKQENVSGRFLRKRKEN